MSAHPANQVPAVELRVLDPGGQHLTFTWQVRDGHGHLLATGQVAGAPNTPQLAGWRYPARGGQLATVLIGDTLVIVPGGDWYACPPCHHLVEAGQWDALSARARLPLDQGAALWATFQACRAGTPTPLHPQDRDDRDGGASR